MANLKENAKVDTIQGHIILYCKSHYQVKDVSFIEGLKRIWAIRCGYDYEEKDNSMLEYIANDLFNIIYQTYDIDIIDFQKKLHKELCNTFYRTKNTVYLIEKIIHYYKHYLAFLKVNEYDKETGITTNILKLPSPNKELFKRILKGNGVSSDYNLISK